MGQRGEGAVPDPVHQIPEGHPAIHGRTESERVDEQPHRVLGRQRGPSRDRSRDDEVVLPRVPVQYRFPRREQDHERCRAELTCQAGHASLRPLEGHLVPALVENLRPGAVRWNVHCGCHAGQLVPPERDQALVDRRRGHVHVPRRRLDGQARVDPRQVVEDQAHAPAVAEEVVQGQLEQPPVRSLGGERGAHGWRAVQTRRRARGGTGHVQPGDLRRLRQDQLPRVVVLLHHDGPQGLVTGEHLVERLGERGHVQRAGEFDPVGHEIHRAVGHQLVVQPHPALGRGQRIQVPVAQPVRGPQGPVVPSCPRQPVDRRRQRGDRGVVEHEPQRNVHSGHRRQPGPHPCRRQRVPAQLEEVPVGRAVPENLTPDRPDGLFGRCPCSRRSRRSHRVVGGRQRQRVRVDLAVRVERQAGHLDEDRGHQVARDPAGQVRPQIVDPGTARQHDVGDQPHVPGPVHPDDHLGQSGETPQVFLHLGRLDPMAANLDLTVGAADELQLPVSSCTHEITRGVHPLPRRGGERVGHEPFRGLPRLAEIASGHPVTADVELARRPRRHRLQVGVQHVRVAARGGPADRDGRLGADEVVAPIRRRVGRDLRRAVQVDELGVRAVPQKACHRAHVRLFAAEREVAHGAENFRVVDRDLPEQRGRQEQHAHLVAAQRFLKTFGDEHVVQAEADQSRAVEQRAPRLEGRGVERDVGRLHSGVVLADGDGVVAAHQPDDVAVTDRDSFRNAGRAGRVHHVGQRLRRHPRCQAGNRLKGDGVVVDGQLRPRQVRGHITSGEHHLDVRVLAHEPQSLQRIRRVEGHIRATGLQRRQRRENPVGCVTEEQPHACLVRDPVPAQVMRQLVRPVVELLIGQCDAVTQDRCGSGRPVHPLLEQLVDGVVTWVQPVTHRGPSCWMCCGT